MNEHLYSPGERAILRELRALRREITQMDQAGEALKNEIDTLDADVKADNEAVVQGGEAIAAAGSKFAELKALLEKQSSGAALSDQEAQELTTLTTEVEGHLSTANTELAAHVKALGEDAAAA